MSRPDLFATSHIPDAEKLFQEVMAFRGEFSETHLNSAIEQTELKVQAKLLRKKVLKSPVPLPPLGKVAAYNPDKDSKDAFELQISRLNTLLAELEQKGVPEVLLLAYKLQRQAEIDQMFPRQALRLRLEEDWRYVGLLMKQKGKPPEEIRQYLKRKVRETKPLTPAEVKVFIDQRRDFAFVISGALQKVGVEPSMAPQTQPSKAPLKKPMYSPLPSVMKL